MRFLVDECTGPSVARWLREIGHDVCSVYDEMRGEADHTILMRAYAEERILITNDKDFGEKVFRDGYPHKGVISLRLVDERAASKISVLRRLLELYSDQLIGYFVVVTESRVRFVRRTDPRVR